MKAAVLEKPEVLVLKDVPKPSCKKGEVLVKVRACGICGSDIRYYKGENPWAQHTLGKHVQNPSNMILGHEFSGDVVDVGDKQYESLLGKRVFVEPYNTCGMCEFCRTGRYNLCRNTLHIGHGAGWGQMDYYPGGMAEYCQVWATHAYELPEEISYEEATVLDPLAVAIHAISIAEFSAVGEVLVLGAGPVGLCIGQVVKAFGATRIYCTDIYDTAISTAQEVGIHYPLNVRTTNIVDFILEKTKGLGVTTIFDTVGDLESQRQALKLLAKGGTLVNLVANSNVIPYSLMDLSGERSIKGSSNNLYEDVLTGINLMRFRLINVKPMITHRYPLREVALGFQTLLNKADLGAVKVIIIP